MTSFINTYVDKDGKETAPALTDMKAVPVTSGGIIADISYDSLSISYPSPEVEIIRYYIGGLSGELKATVTATYENSTKKNLISLERTWDLFLTLLVVF